MKSKLIADAGSSKVEWALVSTDGSVETSFISNGINAVIDDYKSVMDKLNDVAIHFGRNADIGEIHYYGAGCASSETCDKIKNALSEYWKNADITAQSDLLGAARALLAKNKGIACILGTGSNSCLFNGSEIIAHTPSLGYVLGDEGSGATLGKKLLCAIFKRQLPDNVIDIFTHQYGLDLPEILHKTYRSASPSRFLASFAPFLKENIEIPAIRSIVFDEFELFIKRNVAGYDPTMSLPVSFVGSIAFHFESILNEVLKKNGFKTGCIARTPLKGLVEYHSAKNVN